MLLYIDTCSYDDYDKAVKFLLEHGTPIVGRSKVKMTIVAEVSKELMRQMDKEAGLEDALSWGETPLETI